MQIRNKKLRENEMQWLSILLKDQFDKKEEIVRQINCAEVEREYSKFFISIKFSINKQIKPINNCVRVPVEMRVYRKNACPIQFLLHIVNGYVNELEVFSADSSEIDTDIELEKAEEVEVVVER